MMPTTATIITNTIDYDSTPIGGTLDIHEMFYDIVMICLHSIQVFNNHLQSTFNSICQISKIYQPMFET